VESKADGGYGISRDDFRTDLSWGFT